MISNSEFEKVILIFMVAPHRRVIKRMKNCCSLLCALYGKLRKLSIGLPMMLAYVLRVTEENGKNLL